MNTTVAVGNGYQGSSDRTALLFLPRAIEEAREAERVIIHLPFPKAQPEATAARVPVPNTKIWEWLELGLVVILALSVLVTMLFFVAATGTV